jgi:pyridoxamine 5'-phosphate oxidase
MNLSNLRNDFKKGSLELTDLESDPFLQFEKWFQNVLDAKIEEPNAMSLATSTKNAHPSLRTVLLKQFSAKGFVFYTNYKSRKAREMEENPSVALLFFWKELERQVMVTGRAEKVSKLDTIKYFATRPRKSQIGAWISEQSKIIRTRGILNQKFKEMHQKFKEGEVPVPDFWGGFRVVPQTFEFWQGGKNRLHDRFQYTPDDINGWKIERLAP